MRWIDKLESKYSKYAISNLMQYIAIGMGIVFVFEMVASGTVGLLGFSPTLIAQGQVWRLITFLFVPRVFSPLWIIFSLLILVFYGRILESAWGTFKFNMYYLIGTLGTVLASFVIEGLARGLGYQDFYYPVNNYYLYMSLLLACAYVIPDYELRIYFVLPVKLKYLGYIYGAILFFQVLTGPLGTKIEILFSLLNFFIFFGPGIVSKIKRMIYKTNYKQAHKPRMNQRARSHPKSSMNKNAKNGEVIQVAFHCCEICGRTEVDDPTLEFRFCSKCEGRHEYCSDHIFNHEHKGEKVNH